MYVSYTRAGVYTRFSGEIPRQARKFPQVLLGSSTFPSIPLRSHQNFLTGFDRGYTCGIESPRLAAASPGPHFSLPISPFPRHPPPKSSLEERGKGVHERAWKRYMPKKSIVKPCCRSGWRAEYCAG